MLAIFFVWQAVYQQTPNKNMTVAFLNVGQGDSIYIETPSHRQVIVDGGPNASLLSEIGKLMPWYDRTIDVLMISSPDIDHYGGFIDLLQRYDVGLVIEPGTSGGSASYKTLESLIAKKKIKKIIARRGQSIDFGDGVHFDVFFPDRDVAKLATNDSSIIGQLVYGSTTVMFTGDAPKNTEDYVALLDSGRAKSDILKAGHHGSRTSASLDFISAVAPTYAVISAGLNNSYGHPHKETLDLFKKFKIETLITFNLGTIIFKSDGKGWKR